MRNIERNWSEFSYFEKINQIIFLSLNILRFINFDEWLPILYIEWNSIDFDEVQAAAHPNHVHNNSSIHRLHVQYIIKSLRACVISLAIDDNGISDDPRIATAEPTAIRFTQTDLSNLGIVASACGGFRIADGG